MSWIEDGDQLGIPSVILWPLSLLYAAGWAAYRGMYALGIKRPEKPHHRIVCVGNLRVGGSGKSPFTVYLAGLLEQMGHRPVISLSGYGSPRSEAATLAPDGPLDAREWGDEPAMVRDLLPHVPLVVGRRRVLAAEIIAETLPGHVMLMDDGFQHSPLAKDVTIILDPPGLNRLCLPAGPYREPRRYLRLADFVVPGDGELAPAEVGLESADGRERSTPAQGVLVTAVARPQRVLHTLAELGVRVADARLYPDHDPLDQPSVLHGVSEGTPLITTAKDWVKLRVRTDLDPSHVWIVRQRVSLRDDLALRELLRKRLGDAPQ